MLKLPMGWAASSPGMITSFNSKPMRSAFFIQQALRPHRNLGWKKYFPSRVSKRLVDQRGMNLRIGTLIRCGGFAQKVRCAAVLVMLLSALATTAGAHDF